MAWHRKALKKANAAPAHGGSSGGGSGSPSLPPGAPPPVSVDVAPAVEGTPVSEIPGWPGTSLNYRTLYGTYWQEAANRYVAFMPDNATWWRPGYSSPGPLTNVPAEILEEPGPHVGVLGADAVGHAFSFPKWKRWWG